MNNYFDLLSLETIEFIFKKLNLNDLINLRIVDKRFKEICEQIRIKQLYVSDELFIYYRLDNYPSFWFYLNDPTYFNKENLIKFSKFKNYTAIFQLDKYLKRLIIIINDFNFSILNKFKLLEQLEVKTYELIDNYKLSLDHLKIVDFLLLRNSDFKLTFNTIKLFAFKLQNEDSDAFVFNYPDKILFFVIEYNSIFDSPYNNNLKNFTTRYTNFSNLQYLKLTGLDYYDQIDRYILSQFKNLKILDLYMDYLFIEYDNLIEDIKFLINEKENLKRSELEIYFQGVKLINQDKLNQRKLSPNSSVFDFSPFEFQIKNYDLLKDNCERNKINYCDLIKLIKKIPSSFTNKFPFIDSVQANDHIDNEDQFIKFLKNLQYLFKLELINCKLNQSFYDELINLVYLNDLEYLEIGEKKDLGINFDFILNLKKLKEFETNQIIANHIDLISKLFKKNQNIEEFTFKFDTKNYIKINKYSFEIESYYLDDNLKKVKNFSIDKLNAIDNVILILKGLKF